MPAPRARREYEKEGSEVLVNSHRVFNSVGGAVGDPVWGKRHAQVRCYIRNGGSRSAAARYNGGCDPVWGCVGGNWRNRVGFGTMLDRPKINIRRA